MYSMLDQKYYTSNSEQAVESALGVQFKNWKLGVQWGTDSSSSSYEFSSASFQWMSFSGGDSPLAMTNSWDQWITSTKYAPAQVARILSPIWELFTGVQSSNLAKAVNQYYRESDENLTKLPPVAMSMQLGLDFYSNSGTSMYADSGSTTAWNHNDGLASETTYLTAGVEKADAIWKLPKGAMNPGVIRPGNCQTRENPDPSDPEQLFCPTDTWFYSLARQRCDAKGGEGAPKDCFSAKSYQCCQLLF